MGRGGVAKPALALAIVILLAVDVFALTRTDGTSVTVSEAVRRFQEAPQVGTTVVADAPTTLPPDSNASTTTAPPVTQPTSPSTVTATTAPSASPEVSAGTAARRPAPGVYRYTTEGSESVSILGAQRRYPAVTTRTVRHGGGCAWTFHIILLEEHQEEHVACSHPGVFDLTGSTNDVRWFGLATTTTMACDPAIRHVDVAAGLWSNRAFLCREDAGSTFSGTTSVLGEETVDVGGEARRAWRLSVTGTFEGKTRGTVTVTELIDQETWITLFEQRRNDLRHQAPIGDINYRQDVTLRLRSVTPVG